MNKLLLNSFLASTLLYSGCETFQGGPHDPPIVAPSPIAALVTLNKLPELDGEPIYIGVNSFKD